MTTPSNGDARMKRPELERTDPIRNIFRAFNQTDGRDPAPPPPLQGAGARRFEDDHVWGVSGGQQPEVPHVGDAQPEPFVGWAAGPLWDTAADSVKAAYNVIGQQIREGEQAASLLNKGLAGQGVKTLPKALNRLMQTYSDLGAVWMELLGAVLEREGAAAPQPAAAPAAPTGGGAASVEVTASQPVTARARLDRRPVGALIVHPLRSASDPSLEIKGVSAEGTVLKVEVPAGQPAGTYHGMVLEDGVEEPAGALTVKIAARPEG